MSKILVIEPYRILQQGIAISLYPENDVQLLDGVPEKLSSNDFDAAIVDVTSLRQCNPLDAAALRAIQGWKLPTIWIDDEASARVSNHGEAVMLQPPVDRQALVAALRECLGAASSGKDKAPVGQRSEDKRRSSEAMAKEKTSDTPDAAEIIELTDIVEAEPGTKTSGDKKK